MLNIRQEQVEDMRQSRTEQLRQAQLRAFREQGLKTEDDPSARTIVLTDKAGGTAKITPAPTVTSGEGRTHQFEHDPKGQLTAITDPVGLRVQYERDAQQRLVAIHRGPNNTHHFEYDAQSNLSAIQFPDNTVQKYNHNNKGQVTTVTDRNGQQTHYKYSETGQLISQIDRNGNETRFEYADINAPSAIIFPNGDRHEFEYYEDGYIMRVNGAEHATFKIDEIAETYEVTYADGTHVHYLFNDEKIVEASNETCTVKLEYDEKGHIISEDTDGQIVKYLYNEVGALIAITTPDGEKLQFERDKEHRVSKITDWAGKQYEIDYDPSGTLGGIKYPNRTSLSQQVTAMGLPQTLHVNSPLSPIIACQYTYDVCDRLIEATENDNRKSYRYDKEGRLLGIQASEQFKLDAQGNQKACNSLDQLEQQNDQSFSYDPLGNMTTGVCPKGETQYHYNGRNQLISVTTPAGETRYSYDAFGRRIRKECNGKITRYIWAGQQLLCEITEKDGQTITRRDYLMYPERSVPLAMRINDKIYCIHPGRRAEALCMTDQTGKVVWQADYSAFGEARITEQSISQPWRLAGQYYDEETGLHYALARYYNPQLGRYLSKDPLFDEGGSSNFYIYCDGDPINRSDPNGEFIFTAILVGAAIGAAVGAGVEWYRQKKAIERGEQEGYDGWGIAKSAAIGGVIGAVGGGVGAAVEGAFAVGVTATVAGGAGVGALSGVVSSLAEQCALAALTGKELKPWEVAKEALIDGVIGAGIGAVTAGAGGWLARRARKGVQEGVEEVSNNFKVFDNFSAEARFSLGNASADDLAKISKLAESNPDVELLLRSAFYSQRKAAQSRVLDPNSADFKAIENPLDFVEGSLENIKLVEARGYPFGFSSREQFVEFRNKIAEQVDSLGLPRDQVILQGSNLFKNNPGDIDVGIRLSADEFDDFVRGKSLIAGKPKEIDSVERAIRVGKLDDTKMFGPPSARRGFRNTLKELSNTRNNQVDFSLIKEGSVFDQIINRNIFSL
jgi:RHS repeat-associated protein